MRMRVSLITLGDPGRLTGGYLYHRRMAEAAPRNHASLEFISFPRAPFPLPAAAGPHVIAQVRAHDPDVLVVDSIAAAFAAPWLRRWQLPAAAIVHQSPGGIDNSGVRIRIQAPLDMALYRRVDSIMVASVSLGDELRARGIPDRKIELVPPGRNPTTAQLDILPDLRSGRKAALLCVGNWIPRKGIADLLEAVSRLPPDVATLHLVGDNEGSRRYTRSIHARLQRTDLRDRVVVHGWKPSQEVARMYAAADVFVLPSIREPYGTVYGEAMAAGLPVVGWRAGNLPYLARDGIDGLIVPTGDSEGLTRALLTICLDESLRSRMASAAQERAGEFPTWEETAAIFFGRLRELQQRVTKK
jgi:glycosyltransferase involved in cell wall biosynthesis